MLGVLIENYGWEIGFYVTSIFTFVFIVMWYYFVADSPAKHPRISLKERNMIKESIGSSLSTHKTFPPLVGLLTSLPFIALTLLHYGSGTFLCYLIELFKLNYFILSQSQEVYGVSIFSKPPRRSSWPKCSTLISQKQATFHRCRRLRDSFVALVSAHSVTCCGERKSSQWQSSGNHFVSSVSRCVRRACLMGNLNFFMKIYCSSHRAGTFSTYNLLLDLWPLHLRGRCHSVHGFQWRCDHDESAKRTGSSTELRRHALWNY